MGCRDASSGIAVLPRAFPELACRAVFKHVPEDFAVDETLSFAPDDDGEHLLLRVEKRGTETRQMARCLAQIFGVLPMDVGYAGMKDKRAVARQWFSVHTPEPGERAAAQGVRVLEQRRHGRKLRRGELAGNAFKVRLRDLRGDGWQPRLQRIAAVGVPNYFGPQRFAADNLQRALTWLPDRRRRSVSRFTQGIYLSVLRSHLFNAVLAERVRRDCWNSAVAGDVLEAGATDSLLPTGPLWGRGRSPATDLAAELETAALAEFAEVRDGLEHAGLRQQRRLLVLQPLQLGWQQDGAELNLQFALPAGGYATSLLREAFDLGLEHAREAGP